MAPPHLWFGVTGKKHEGIGAVNIPNAITLGRVFLVPLVFWLVVTEQSKLAFLLFVVAGISDGIDGFLAKRFGWQTELGAYLDPLADKLLLVSIFVALGVLGALPSWVVIAVVSRDILIVAGVVLAWLLDHPMTIRPLWISKANTVAQILLVGTVLAGLGFKIEFGMLLTLLIWVTAALTVLSMAAYLRQWLAHMSG